MIEGSAVGLSADRLLSELILVGNDLNLFLGGFAEASSQPTWHVGRILQAIAYTLNPKPYILNPKP